MRYLAALIAALALGACSTTTPLTASSACADQKSTWSAYSSCAKTRLAGTQDPLAIKYVNWLDLANRRLAAGTNTEQQVWEADTLIQAKIADTLVDRNEARAEHRRNALMTMGTILMTQPSTTYAAPAFRAPVTCNNRGATTTCF